MKASIGVRAQSLVMTAGTAGRTNGAKAHQATPSRWRSRSVRPSGQAAPRSIQRLRSATCSLESGSAFLGISGESPLTFSISRLCSALPATNAGPSPPPLFTSSSDVNTRPPLGPTGPWHETHRFSKIGATRSRKKARSSAFGGFAARVAEIPVPSSNVAASSKAVRLIESRSSSKNPPWDDSTIIQHRGDVGQEVRAESPVVHFSCFIAV